MSSRNAGIEFTLNWASELAHHADRLYLPRVDLWRDFLPGALADAVAPLAVGESAGERFAAGELVSAYDKGLVREIGDKQFNRKFGHLVVEPRVGRFYPRGMIAGVAGIFPEEYKPFRVVGRSKDRLKVDLNHPLAAFDLELSATVVEDLEPHPRFGGACSDVADLITDKGPGLQALSSSLETDFFHDYPFDRLDDNPDTVFYQMPRMVEHVDAVATGLMGRIYGRLLQRGARVLDLMSSWVSHVPDSMDVELWGLGLNEEELAANPRLGDRRLHDLNREPRLPYADASFDAVICANSVEYLVKPLEVFAEVGRVLKPGGRFINVFSDRWFPPKVINLWTEIHPFERMGLVLECLRRTDGFGGFHTESVRGYQRPEDDKYRNVTPKADPVFAVWAAKSM